jgi:hypothetical protein
MSARTSVIWDEGEKERSFEATQYVTNPLEGNLNPNASEGIEDLLNGILPQTDADADADAEGGGDEK